MMKQLACLMFGLAIGVACSPGGGSAPQGAAGQQGGVPAVAQAPNAGTPPASGPPAAAGTQAESGAPLAPPKPRFREVIIPAGMTMTVTLETSVSSDTSRVEDAVRAKLAKAIVIDGRTAVPEGVEVTGSVIEARQSGRVQGVASIAFRFDRLRLGDATYNIRTARIAREAGATKGEDATKIGIGAGAGAVVGAIAGGTKGAAVGAAVGAGAGTGVVVATRGEEVHMVAGAVLTTRIDEPITIQVPVE